MNVEGAEMRLLSIVLLLISVIADGCCIQKERMEPPHPGITSSWVEKEENGVHFMGNFVLKVGEATDNGKLQVKVVELIAGDPCAEYGSYAHQDKVKLQFVNLADKKILCEETCVQGGSTTLLSDRCRYIPNVFGVAAIYVKSINIKEKWAYFELAG
jgi:hypothetical protein